MIKNKLAFISLVILVLYSRRGSTITNPQVWVEDGVFFIPEFLEYGISSLLIPIAGYLAFIPKIITGISLTFPYEYPVVSSTLAWLYTVFVLSIICYAPLILKGRFLCAIGCLMIPSDPEVFGTSIYTLWWSGLLVIIISLWRDNETWIKTRISLLFIAGLSTPISVILSPIFFVRSLIFKRKTDKTILISSIFCSIIQLYFIFINDTGSALNEYNEKKITTIFKKFFGYFILNHDTELNGQLWIISYIFLIFIIVCLIKIKSKFLSFALIYILFINIFLSVYRVNISELHPIFAGPRYFFFPYIIIFWILIQGIYSFKNNILKYLVIIFLSMMLYNSFSSGWSRDHDDLFWAKNLESSKYFDGYNMPMNVKPFVGVGVNYTTFFKEKLNVPTDENVTDLKFDDSVGIAGHIGIDIPFAPTEYFRIDARYIDIKTDASIKVDGVKTELGEVDISPWVYGVAFVKQF